MKISTLSLALKVSKSTSRFLKSPTYFKPFSFLSLRAIIAVLICSSILCSSAIFLFKNAKLSWLWVSKKWSRRFGTEIAKTCEEQRLRKTVKRNWLKARRDDPKPPSYLLSNWNQRKQRYAQPKVLEEGHFA